MVRWIKLTPVGFRYDTIQSYLALANEPTATPVSPQSTLPVLRSLWLTIQKFLASHSIKIYP